MDSNRMDGSHSGSGCGDAGANTERRSSARHTSILRLALIDASGFTQLCRITNVSVQGLQATVFGSVSAGSTVQIRIPDEIALEGTIVWAKENCVGIKLDQPLPHSSILRLGGNGSGQGRRRRLPRIQIAAAASLSTGLYSYPVELIDISPGGAMVRTRDRLPGRGPITLNVLGLPKIAGQVRWATDERVGLLFNEAIALRTLTDWLLELCGQSGNGDASRMDACTSVAS
jgi:hypothetical protein